ncbi:Photosystem I P700 chlorophyll a apoprotein A2 [Kordia antarctica]|uniref:Photosystem I P700 chlorophyll a apoprotein A2 n=2 Tax=Kordia antarctica TaxID=1218801 RepID=A0A7L4ZP18_9FLAO|nr:Photosystem I P700 chlorophyll a apoprotein A2 [Kordia antarctica]
MLILSAFFTVTFANAQGPEALAMETSEYYSDVTTKDIENRAIKALDPNGFLYHFENLNINTSYSEHATAFFRDKVIVSSSKRIGAFSSKEEGFYNLYCGDLNQKGAIKNLVNFSRAINTKESNEGSVALSSAENVVFFTRSIEENGQHNLKIFRAEMVDYQWSNFEMLPFNEVGYAIENPVLSPDDKIIYFSANIPGSKGGFDIFSVTINEDGTYNAPKNLGSEINTHKDEKFPYVMGDNSALYFSSNGHYNLGGLDIFESKIIDGKFNFPVNMGSSLNSTEDDFGFLMDQSNSGFFTSNRAGGKGGNDIYYFKRKKTTQQLQGTIVDFKTNMVLPNATVTVVDTYGRVVDKITSDDKGVFTTTVIPYNSYTLHASKDGFIETDEEFESFRGDDFKHTVTIKLPQAKAEIVVEAEKLVIKIENIYFDYNKWSIKDESTLSLNKIVDVLNEHPEMNIEINAHTDARGKASYNYKLSDKRAASAKAYLIANGVDAERLVSKGYGETQPKENCGTTCSETQHETNRRIEFVIVE